MRKSFLLKTFLLVILLAAVLAVIVAMMRSSFEAGTMQAARTQTLFEQFVIAGSPIVWFVLLPMSLITVYLAAEHCLTIRRKKLLPRGIGARTVETIRQFGAGQLEARIGDRNDFVSIAAGKAVATGGADWFRMRNTFSNRCRSSLHGLYAGLSGLI